MTVIDLVSDPSGETVVTHRVKEDSKLMRTCNHTHLVRTVQQNSNHSISCVFCQKTMGPMMRRCRACGVVGHKICFERKRKPPASLAGGNGGKRKKVKKAAVKRTVKKAKKAAGKKAKRTVSGKATKKTKKTKKRTVKRNSIQTRSKTVVARKTGGRHR